MKLKSLEAYLVLRKRATELHKEGHTQTWIAQVLGVALPTVNRWIIAYRKEGEASIRHQPMGGSLPKLPVEQQAELVELLKDGAHAHGFEGDYWTSRRIADLIEQKFGVIYQPRTVRDLLQRLGFSYQVAAKKHYKQDEAKVQEWLNETLAELKKKPRSKT